MIGKVISNILYLLLSLFSVLNHLLLFKAMIVIYNYFKSNLILADTSSLGIHRETPGPEAWGATSSRGTSKLMH